MIAKTIAAVVYSVWLQKIIDAHVRKTWDTDRSDADEKEDERFNNLWRELQEQQQQRLWGLSSDLNTLRDRETWIDTDWKPMTEQALAREQADAFHNKDWDRLLVNLRRPPRFLPRSQVDDMRGRAWLAMGHPEVALLFFDNAARLDPSNVTCHLMSLECLKAISDWEVLLQRAEAYVRDKDAPSRLLFAVADSLQLYADAVAAPAFYHQAIHVIDRGLQQLRLQAALEPLEPVIAAAYATKAFCLQRLSQFGAALEVFDVAIEAFPENSTLLSARGLLKQQLDRHDAMDDFKHAVEMGTTVVWPYLELARDALQVRQWEAAIDFCRLGIWRSGRRSITAPLFDLLAIARHKQGAAIESVRSTIETAHSLDPLSEEIRSHFNTLKEGNIVSPEHDWRISLKAPASAMSDVHAELRVAA
jgi:tetratricopeptide (TPR) repeat protein